MTALTVERRNILLEVVRRRMLVDPDYFITSAMTDEKGDRLSQYRIHLRLQQFITENRKGVIELPREHGKTTQLIGRSVFEIARNHNIRMKIISSADGLAIARGKALREILGSALLRKVFPNVLPGREWTDQKFSVRRDIITPESTVECYGLHSKAVGGRADLLWLDDPDDEDVVVSETKRNRNWDRVSNVWLNLLSPDGRVFVICTPWHKRDIAHRLKANGWPNMRVAINEFESVWPERWSAEKLKDKKTDIGSLAYGRGYGLKVLSDEDAPIKENWFKYWYDVPKLSVLGIAVDPAIGEKKTSDFTAIGVLGVNFHNEILLLESIRRRMDFPTTLNTILELAPQMEHKYKLRPYIGVEETAYQKALPQQLRKESRYPILGLGAHKSKFIRISRFSVYVENGKVFLKGMKGTVHPDQQEVLDECTEFPAGEYDDCVDMLAHGTEMMMKLSGRPKPAGRGR